MKASHYLSVFCLVLQISAQSGAQAEPERPQKRGFELGEKGERHSHPMLKHWSEADQNKDGKLSFAEFQKLERVSQIPADKQALLFERLDKNSNSSIEHEELHPPQQDEPKERFFPILRQIDTNKDKQISFEEFTVSPLIRRLPADRQRQMFDRMDHNGDGILSHNDQPEGERPFKPGMKRGDFPERPPHPDNKPPHPEHRMHMGLQQWDTNQDGKLNFPEFQAAPFNKNMGEDAQEDRFESIDANHDQQITPEEWQKQPMRKPRPNDSEPHRRPHPKAESPDSEMMEE
jgi:Ca2+-binding EF-hand superfamily protein